MFFVASNGTARDAVSSYGKFATINGLTLYYEESGNLLITKVFAIAGGDGTLLSICSYLRQQNKNQLRYQRDRTRNTLLSQILETLTVIGWVSCINVFEIRILDTEHHKNK